MPAVRTLDFNRPAVYFGSSVAQFAYRTPWSPTHAQEPKSRHAYARDAFCGVARATRDLFGAAALRLSGMPGDEMRQADLAELRTRRAHRVGAALGWGAACLLGTAIGAATWLNPVDAAHDLATRGAIAAARTRAAEDLRDIEVSWSRDLTVCHSEADVERLLTMVQDYADEGRDAGTPLGHAALGLVLVDRALAHIAAEPQHAAASALQRAQRAFATQARKHAVLHCKDMRTGALYMPDSPALLRTKCALLALSAPVVASLNVLLTMALRTGQAVEAACMRQGPREVLDPLAQVALAPLLGLGLQVTALAGVLAPNLGRKLYARLEAPMVWKMAPCFMPMGYEVARPNLARTGISMVPRHGLGGLPVEGGHF